MDYTTYIDAKLLILVPVLYALGQMIKSTEKINNKYIPMILGIVGVVLAIFYMMAAEPFSYIGVFTGIVQGIMTSAAAVYANQLVKQSKE